MNDFCFVEPVDRLSEGVVVAVADAANGRYEAGFGQALGVFDRDVLHAAIGVMDQPAADRATIVQSLFQGVQHEACVCGPADAPADNPAGVGVDDERHIECRCFEHSHR